MKDTAIIILAAGTSSRLGKPKQLVTYRGKTLIERLVSEVENIPDSKVFVVTGALQEKIEQILSTHQVEKYIINPGYREGMGTSISAGVNYLRSLSEYDRIIISVCDQPYLKQVNFRNLISVSNKFPDSIVISEYTKGNGPPVLFPRRYFEKLSKLEGDNGAKEIIKSAWDRVKKVNFSEGYIDIDTEEDLAQLKGP